MTPRDNHLEIAKLKVRVRSLEDDVAQMLAGDDEAPHADECWEWVVTPRGRLAAALLERL